MSRRFAKISVAGGPVTGKSSLGLILGSALATSWEKVILIDSTAKGPKLVGHPSLGPFRLDALKADGDFVSPAQWVAALKRACDSGAEVAVVDTASEEWDWCLERREKLGGGLPAWKQINNEHYRFVRAIMRCELHVVSILRRKEKFRMSSDPGKKSEIVSLGLCSEMRPNFERGMDVVIGIDSAFAARVEHDQTRKFEKNGTPLPMREIGSRIKSWVEGPKVDGERQ